MKKLLIVIGSFFNSHSYSPTLVKNVRTVDSCNVYTSAKKWKVFNDTNYFTKVITKDTIPQWNIDSVKCDDKNNLTTNRIFIPQ